MLDEILASWQWTDEPAEATGGRIVDAAMASEVDTSLSAPDPDWYTDTFTSDTPTIYLIYRVESDTDETVGVTWRADGQIVAEGEFNVPVGSTWAYQSLNAPPGGFPPGDYEIELEVLGSGDTEVVTFTVE